MHIEIDIPRPFATLSVIAVVAALGVAWFPVSSGASQNTEPIVVEQRDRENPEDDTVDFTAVKDDQTEDDRMRASAEAATTRGYAQKSLTHEAADEPSMFTAQLTGPEADMQQARAEQALLARKEEMLRYELSVLQHEREMLGENIDPTLESQFRIAALQLTKLLKNEREAESFLKDALHQIWEAEGRTTRFAESLESDGTTPVFAWPVEPLLGISAYFQDAAYKARFGFEHWAIDIPVDQGSDVLAAADGTVEDVVDNGLGFNYITIKHKGGFVTLYGHVSKFNVIKGQLVRRGDLIAKSGGMPGLPGSGFSTGPHVHFGLRVEGKAVDPLEYLPKR